MRNIFTEILRLWPPFLGAYRVTNTDIEVGDFHVPKGYVNAILIVSKLHKATKCRWRYDDMFYIYYRYGILCATFAAHRDPKIFPRPEEFLPTRWDNENSNDKDKMFGFGSGPHACVGERIMWDVMIHVGKEMIRRYKWTLPNPRVSTNLTSPPSSSKTENEDSILETFVPELDMKYLPVSRPRILEPLLIEQRTT